MLNQLTQRMTLKENDACVRHVARPISCNNLGVDSPTGTDRLPQGNSVGYQQSQKLN